jgi:hypothetical protein
MQSFLKPGQKKLLYAPSGPTAPQFAGISQYTAAFQDSHFLLSIGRVLLIGVVQVPLMLLFSVCLALLLDARRVKAREIGTTDGANRLRFRPISWNNEVNGDSCGWSRKVHIKALIAPGTA